MSTKLVAGDWISQAEAARLRRVSRQAVAKLVKADRVRTLSIGDRVLVHRGDLEAYVPAKRGRRKK